MVTFEVICALNFELWECFRLGKAKTKGGFKQKMPQVKFWFWNEYCWDQRLLPNKTWWEIRDGWLVGNWVAWIYLKQWNGTLCTNIEKSPTSRLGWCDWFWSEISCMRDWSRLCLGKKELQHIATAMKLTPPCDFYSCFCNPRMFIFFAYLSPEDLAILSPNLSKTPNLNWGDAWRIEDSLATISFRSLDETSSEMKPGCGKSLLNQAVASYPLVN